MSYKTKSKIRSKNSSQLSKVEAVASHIGLAALSMAAVITVTQLQHARPHKAEIFHKPAANSIVGQLEAAEKQVSKKFKKDKDKIRHHTVTYGVHMRMPATVGAS